MSPHPPLCRKLSLWPSLTYDNHHHTGCFHTQHLTRFSTFTLSTFALLLACCEFCLCAWALAMYGSRCDIHYSRFSTQRRNSRESTLLTSFSSYFLPHWIFLSTIVMLCSACRKARGEGIFLFVYKEQEKSASLMAMSTRRKRIVCMWKKEEKRGAHNPEENSNAGKFRFFFSFFSFTHSRFRFRSLSIAATPLRLFGWVLERGGRK